MGFRNYDQSWGMQRALLSPTILYRAAIHIAGVCSVVSPHTGGHTFQKRSKYGEEYTSAVSAQDVKNETEQGGYSNNLTTKDLVWDCVSFVTKQKR